MSTLTVIGVAVAAVAVLLVLVIRFKVPAFVALLAAALVTALASGMPLDEVIPTFVDGMGGTLGSVALLVGLGAMLGAIIEKTGGAAALATTLTAALGPRRVGPALLLTSGVFAVPIFFDVGFIIMLPIIFSFARAAGHRAPIAVGAPIAALMVFIHNMVPPHPGVTGSSTLLGADVGLVTLLGLGIAVPMGFLVHVVGRLITDRRDFPIDPMVRRRFEQTVDAQDRRATGEEIGTEGGDGSGGAAGRRAPAGGGDVATAVRTAPTPVRGPGAVSVASMVVLPVLMITVGTLGSLVVAEESLPGRVVSLVGEPAFALLVTVAAAIFVLGIRGGWSMRDLGGVMDSSLAPAAIVVFVTGAGGVFAEVLTQTGVGDTISQELLGTGMPILLMAFLLATVFKVAQGSGTVATLASAGLVQNVVVDGDFTSFQVALIVLAIGCGSVALSHINDSGFWVANTFLGLSVADGLRTWTVLTTVLGWTTMIILAALWLLAA
ncbi:GntP family transporter [Nesterenkonia sp. F]|uniref:GntP family transporter n=1 Tax=Nesterenkonia sp. F TaxID=795955 RepID=UPI000255D0B5|nr:GntP family transporter [Nesterenkonia sp. F]